MVRRCSTTYRWTSWFTSEWAAKETTLSPSAGRLVPSTLMLPRESPSRDLSKIQILIRTKHHYSSKEKTSKRQMSETIQISWCSATLIEDRHFRPGLETSSNSGSRRLSMRKRRAIATTRPTLETKVSCSKTWSSSKMTMMRPMRT